MERWNHGLIRSKLEKFANRVNFGHYTTKQHITVVFPFSPQICGPVCRYYKTLTLAKGREIVDQG